MRHACLLSQGGAGDRGEQGPPGVNGFQVCDRWQLHVMTVTSTLDIRRLACI